jgi:hypothetical protein
VPGGPGRLALATPLVAMVAALAASALVGCGGDDGQADDSGQSAAAAGSGPPVTARREAAREGQPAITVGSTVITFAQAEDELDAIGSNRAYLAFVDEQLAAGGGSAQLGEGFDPAFARQTLSRLVAFTLVHDGVVARGVTPGDDCRVVAGERLPLDLTGGDAAAGTRLLGGFSPAYQEQLLQRRAELAALTASLAGVSCAQTVPPVPGAASTAPVPGTPTGDEVLRLAQSRYKEWLDEQLATTPIAVEPSIGTFVPARAAIVPPGAS